MATKTGLSISPRATEVGGALLWTALPSASLVVTVTTLTADQVRRGALHAADDRQGLPEVALVAPRRMGQGHEHLPRLAAGLADVVLYDGVPAVAPVLVPEPLEDALGGVALLPGNAMIIVQNLVDYAGEWLELGLPAWGLSLVTRRD